MRVLHILGELKPSGAEVMYHAAAGLWKQEGLDCEILSAGEKLGVFAPTLENDGCRIHHIPFSARAGLVASARHLVAVYQFLRRNRFDVVHINSEYANFWYALVARLAGNRRLFRTIHSNFRFTGFLRLERRIQRWIVRRLFKTTTIAIGPSVRSTELQCFRNITVVAPNWFDSRRFRPPTKAQRDAARMSLDVAPETTVITSVGNCSAVKNHAAIVQALATIPRRSSLLYLHCGLEDTDQLEKKLANDLNVADRVRFLGFVPDVLPLLHASDIYVMPSLYEGFSISVLEAMGSGLPAILARVPGLHDLADGGSGIEWVEPTAESVAQAILRFLTAPAEVRQGVGQQLSATVHEHFGVEKGARAYARLYKGGI